MLAEFILVSLIALSPNSFNTGYMNRFTTITACEHAAQAMRQGNATTGQQERQFVCLKYDGSK